MFRAIEERSSCHQEKLMMILEQNPRIGGAVDLGQLEKLKDLKATGENDSPRATVNKYNKQ